MAQQLKRYRSVKEVLAEPQIENDFIMSRPSHPGDAVINKNGFRQGYRITDAQGRVSWMAREEFEEEFQEIKQEDNHG